VVGLALQLYLSEIMEVTGPIKIGAILKGGWQQNRGRAALWSKPILNTQPILGVQRALRR